MVFFPDQTPRLGVNIDHFATLRQLRHTPYPSVMEAARVAIEAGADQITVHPREDQRHIQQEDVRQILAEVTTPRKVPLNMEMAMAEPMVAFAKKIKPQWCCLVPEKREELTTEGGLDVRRHLNKLQQVVPELQAVGCQVSLFVEPDKEVVELAMGLKVDALEFHTGRYGMAAQKAFGDQSEAIQKAELKRLQGAALLGRSEGVHVHAGHGLDTKNVRALVELEDDQGKPLFEEFNIGHYIVCRAALVGLDQAVREMKAEVVAP